MCLWYKLDLEWQLKSILASYLVTCHWYQYGNIYTQATPVKLLLLSVDVKASWWKIIILLVVLFKYKYFYNKHITWQHLMVKLLNKIMVSAFHSIFVLLSIEHSINKMRLEEIQFNTFNTFALLQNEIFWQKQDVQYAGRKICKMKMLISKVHYWIIYLSFALDLADCSNRCFLLPFNSSSLSSFKTSLYGL